MEMKIPPGKVRHFVRNVCKSREVLITVSTKKGMVITRSLTAGRIWHSRLPPHSIHIVVLRGPRSYNGTSSSNSWTRIRRYRLHIPLVRAQTDRRSLRALQVS